ncbi:MAG: DUF3237 domain-containing protein [Fusobacteriaceae bacterium]|nr:DUF3237 domain-containing protein [Fusobacteriaceae bacterium]
MKKIFTIDIKVGKPILIGQDENMGRRQLIPILEGELIGENIRGIVLEGGVDSQIIKPNGICELSARYGIILDDGNGIYIENNGIRTVPEEYIETVKKGNFIDPQLYYFKTTPKFEVYSEKYSWLTKKIFICEAKRMSEKVILDFFEI